MPTKLKVVISVSIIAGLALFGTIVYKSENGSGLPALAILFSGTAAWVAFIINSLEAQKQNTENAQKAREQSRKQHTINFLSQTNHASDIYTNHWSKVSTKYSESNVLTYEEYKRIKRTTDEKEILNSMLYLLSYFEFVAVGIKKDDFEETLMKDLLEGRLKQVASLFKNVIVGIREDQKSRGEKPTILENFNELHKNWNGEYVHDL